MPRDGGLSETGAGPVFSAERSTHLVGSLGDKRLDRIGDEDVQHLKAAIDGGNKTVNNVLSTLNKALKTAGEWKVIRVMPCTIHLLKVAPPEMSFYDSDEYERVVAAARAIDPRTRWRGQVGLPRSGRPRRVPMTKRLAEALRAHRHLRGARVLCRDDGTTITAHVLRRWLEQAGRRAELEVHGAAHRLRHTFCSHLAMRGAPARAIQELVGHTDLTTTQRYIHRSPAAIEGAIRLLDASNSARPWRHSGDADRGGGGTRLIPDRWVERAAGSEPATGTRPLCAFEARRQ